VLPFPIQIQAGEPIYEQIVHAVKRALATGHLRPGDRFPAVRTISAELRINPNTVQKAVTALVAAGVLEIRSGQGSFVARSVIADRREQARTLEPLVERLIIEASRLGMDEEDLLLFVQKQARKMKNP
jgi:GntR family transcriptional regulator